MGSTQEQLEGISVDFLVGDRNVPVPALIGIVSSLQNAIYVIGAHDTGKEVLRGSARRNYTLAISSTHHSDLHVHLVPAVMLGTEQLALFGQVGINIASSALYDAAKRGFSIIRDHYRGKHPEAVATPDTSQQPTDDALGQSLWQTSCRNATQVIKLGATVRTTLRTPSGYEMSFDATPEGAARIISTDAMLRGKAQRYRNCEVTHVSIPGPTLRARFPAYENAEIRCDCETPATSIVQARVHLRNKYTIVGIPVWTRGKPRPTKIEVITIEDAHGDIILTSIRDEHDDWDEQASIIEGGLFSSAVRRTP